MIMKKYVILVKYTQYYFFIFLIISRSISSAYFYIYWYLKRSDTNVVTNINSNTETVIYKTYKCEISNKLIQKIVHITFFNDMINIKNVIQTCQI